MSTQARDLAAFARGRDAELVLAYLAPWVEKRQSMVEKRVYAILESGEPLDPNVAVQSWAEHRAAGKLLADLEREINIGKSAGERSIGDGV